MKQWLRLIKTNKYHPIPTQSMEVAVMEAQNNLKLYH